MASLSRDYYEFFGLDRKLVVDSASLQKRFYELSRQWHPDKFSRKPAGEQELALEATSILNDGYRTLKDPIKRAEYLLTRDGFPISEQRSKDVPPELLEEVFELNMMLEELKSGDESARPQLEQSRDHFLALRTGVDDDLLLKYRQHDDAVDAPAAKQTLQEIRGLLNRRRYIENLIRDVELALNPAATLNVEDQL